LQDLRQDRGTVRFVVPFRGRREYFGRWDGRRLTGTISSTGAARGDIGTFELSPQRR
jgi:hypothetical protein